MSAIKKIMAISMLAVMLAMLHVPASLASAVSGIGFTGSGALSIGQSWVACYQPLSFILGSEGGSGFGLGVAPWAFGLQGCTRSLPVYFGAHGYGFPFTLGNYRIGFIPSIC